MSTGISSSDIVGQWSLSFADIDFINSKPTATRLGLASQLKFFSARGFFADDGTLIPNDACWTGFLTMDLLSERNLKVDTNTEIGWIAVATYRWILRSVRWKRAIT